MNRKLLLGMADSLSFAFSYAIAVLVSGIQIGWNCLLCAAILYGSILGARLIMRIYYNVWRYASVEVFLKMILTDFAGALVGSVICLLAVDRKSLSVNLFAATLFCVVTLFSRMLYRHDRNRRRQNVDKEKKINVAIVGAGAVGVQLAVELLNSKTSHYYPCYFVDKDPDKAGNRISGTSAPSFGNIF